jgi:hypothetical protein
MVEAQADPGLPAAADVPGAEDLPLPAGLSVEGAGRDFNS